MQLFQHLKILISHSRIVVGYIRNFCVSFIKLHLMKCWLVLVTFSLYLSSCQKDSDPSLPVLAEKTELNVAYGTNPSQKMDIYLPPGRGTATTKVMVMIHGGGWGVGDKSDLTEYVDTMKRRLSGYAIFNINYRLATGTSNYFPTQENDVKAAIEFIYGKRTEYQISNKFILLGASAGSHLALLHSYKYTMPVKIKAVVDFFGPKDLVDMYNNPASALAPPSALVAVIGATPTTNLTLYQQSSPLTFVSAQSPATIIFQGGADPLVSPSQSVALKNKLQAMGVVHQYFLYPSEKHGWTGANLTDSFDKIVLFLKANVN